MKPENIECGLRIRKIRESQKLSREQLAEISGISTQFLSDIETGKKGMTVSTLKKICDALHVTADYIVYGTNNGKYLEIEPMIASLSKEDQKAIEEILQKIINLI